RALAGKEVPEFPLPHSYLVTRAAICRVPGPKDGRSEENPGREAVHRAACGTTSVPVPARTQAPGSVRVGAGSLSPDAARARDGGHPQSGSLSVCRGEQSCEGACAARV